LARAPPLGDIRVFHQRRLVTQTPDLDQVRPVEPATQHEVELLDLCMNNPLYIGALFSERYSVLAGLYNAAYRQNWLMRHGRHLRGPTTAGLLHQLSIKVAATVRAQSTERALTPAVGFPPSTLPLPLGFPPPGLTPATAAASATTATPARSATSAVRATKRTPSQPPTDDAKKQRKAEQQKSRADVAEKRVSDGFPLCVSACEGEPVDVLRAYLKRWGAVVRGEKSEVVERATRIMTHNNAVQWAISDPPLLLPSDCAERR
jgi:hypothetical protein